MASATNSRGRGRSRGEGQRESPAFLDDILAMAGSLANSRKEYAASQLEGLADSVRQFSGNIPAIPTMKAYAETAADSLEDLAGYVVESDLADMVADAREFTRRHPLAVFGGSIVAGLVATQLVQSRADVMRAAVRSRRERSTPSGRGTSSRGRKARSTAAAAE